MSQADIARPSSPAIATTGRLKDALYDFVSTYVLPNVDPENIFWANQNRASLPPNTEEWATIYLVSQSRHGTPVESFIPGDELVPDKIAIQSLYEYLVQIDIYSSNLNYARERAMVIANIGRSSIGPEFFNRPEYGGCSLLYVDEPRDMAAIMDSQQFVQRFMIQMRLTMPEITTVALQGFDEASIFRLEDIDMHHKP